MTHVFLATDLLSAVGIGILFVVVVFMIGRAASTGDLRIHRSRRRFARHDDNNLSIIGQTGLVDQFNDSQTSASSNYDDLSIYRSHDHVSNIDNSSTHDVDFGSKSTALSEWSSGGQFGDSGGSLGGGFGNRLTDSSSGYSDSSGGSLGGSFGNSLTDGSSGYTDSSGGYSDSSGGLGSSISDSFSDSGGGLGSSLGDSLSDSSSFSDNCSGGSTDN